MLTGVLETKDIVVFGTMRCPFSFGTIVSSFYSWPFLSYVFSTRTHIPLLQLGSDPKEPGIIIIIIIYFEVDHPSLCYREKDKRFKSSSQKKKKKSVEVETRLYSSPPLYL